VVLVKSNQADTSDFQLGGGLKFVPNPCTEIRKVHVEGLIRRYECQAFRVNPLHNLNEGSGDGNQLQVITRSFGNGDA
jgi:hypothetical protein